jgi:hypothetical protein
MGTEDDVIDLCEIDTGIFTDPPDLSNLLSTHNDLTNKSNKRKQQSHSAEYHTDEEWELDLSLLTKTAPPKQSNNNDPGMFTITSHSRLIQMQLTTFIWIHQMETSKVIKQTVQNQVVI